jgi:hypothetical protein
MKKLGFIVVSLTCLALTSCSALFGNKEDEQVNEIFEQGKIDPDLTPSNIGYVPILPFFTGVTNPVDVYVGYDEFIYVVALNDETNPLDNELVIFDQKGTIGKRIIINGATDVTQDRRLQTYVVGRVETNFGNRACVYRLNNTANGNIEFLDTLIHPLCDDSRATTASRSDLDVAVQFTGVATLADNTLYVTRTGPTNDVNSFVRPDNGVLVYNQNGTNIRYAQGLNPVSSSLKSALELSSIATAAGPPQRQQGMNTSKSFLITQADQTQSVEYRTLGITVIEDPDLGTQYSETPSFLNFDYSKADRFMYESFRFKKPEDVYIAPDNLGYIFVVDSGSDSLYIFTPQGYEGVNPPANSGIKRQVIASFGGPGSDGSSSGPFSFKDPSGVCYFRKTVFIADKGNHRICRYKLSNDLE